MRLVLDTNVVISGLLWRGPSARLIDLVAEQVVTACVNPFLADELAEKLGMPKFSARIAIVNAAEALARFEQKAV